MPYFKLLILVSLRTWTRFFAAVDSMLFIGRGNIFHTMKGKAVEVLDTEDVASDMSWMQQS